MDFPEHIQAFWAEFLAKTDRDHNATLYEIFHFDDNETDANELAELVLRGKKAATASLLWQYEKSGKRLPQAGDLSVVTDWQASPLCVIETLGVEIRAFEDVDDDFAAAEGKVICRWSTGDASIGRTLDEYANSWHKRDHPGWRLCASAFGSFLFRLRADQQRREYAK